MFNKTSKILEVLKSNDIDIYHCEIRNKKNGNDFIYQRGEVCHSRGACAEVQY